MLTGSTSATTPDGRSSAVPFLLETSMPGVFAAGDVRHGAVKRVASAVGEGSIAVQLVHLLAAIERLGRRTDRRLAPQELVLSRSWSRSCAASSMSLWRHSAAR